MREEAGARTVGPLVNRGGPVFPAERLHETREWAAHAALSGPRRMVRRWNR